MEEPIQPDDMYDVEQEGTEWDTLDCEDEEFGPDSGEPAHGAGKALAGKHLPSSLAGTTPVFNPVDRSVMSGK
jgi:hypothetical protein